LTVYLLIYGTCVVDQEVIGVYPSMERCEEHIEELLLDRDFARLRGERKVKRHNFEIQDHEMDGF
jgi:hypothetical protein